jgi:hypothetical protein
VALEGPEDLRLEWKVPDVAPFGLFYMEEVT